MLKDFTKGKKNLWGGIGFNKKDLPNGRSLHTKYVWLIIPL
jgi:hypothetical protein